MKGRNITKSCISALLVLVMIAGIVLNPLGSIKADAAATTDDNVLFNAESESQNSFRSDVVYENLSGNNLTFNTPADAFVTPDGYLQINYKSATGAAEDGTFTVWGEGGGSGANDAQWLEFTIKASQEDYANQFIVRIYCDGSSIAEYNFHDWLISANYSEDEIKQAVGRFKTFSLPINKDRAGDYQGMKFKFNQGNSDGTLWIDEIRFNNGVVFDDFDYDLRAASYVDEQGNKPMYRPQSSINGANAGLNYYSGKMWSASTMLANIVDNSNSGGRALQISYDTAKKSYASLYGNIDFSDEPILAMTIKGDASINDCMYVTLLNNGTQVQKIPVSDFVTTVDGNTQASVGSSYATIYKSLPSRTVFDSVEFSFEGSDSRQSGTAYIKDVYCPRFSYTEKHYFDGELDSSKTVEHKGLKFGESFDGDNKYTNHENDVYSLTDTVYSNDAKMISGDNDAVELYYESSVNYTVNYYRGDEKLDRMTVTGSDKLGTVINASDYSNAEITGYEFDHASSDSITLSTGENVINLYYKKAFFDYTINYYYDGELLDSETGTAEYDSYLTYEDKNKTGFRFDSSDPVFGYINISADASNNVINVYYVRDVFNYSIEYYFDNEINSDKTVIGSAAYEEEISTYPDKNEEGYKLVQVVPSTLKIGVDVAANVMKVYYAKDAFGYTVNYYYDGELVETVTGTAVYDSTVSYEDKNIEGYSFVKTEPETGVIVISADAEQNVLNVYYAKRTVEYTFEYYYDGAIDKDLTYTGSGLYGEVIEYKPQPKDGYKFVKAEPEKITLGDDGNLIKVYYEKIPEETKPEVPEETTTEKPAPTPTPGTGDTTSMLPILLLLLSVCGIISALYMRRRAR